MPKLFFNHKSFDDLHVLSQAECTPFRDLPHDKIRIRSEEAVRSADAILDSMAQKGVPALPATLYMQYYRNGNRVNYETPYFARRDHVLTLALAAVTVRGTPNAGKYTDALVDYLWAICEESTWVIPAHNAPAHGNPKNCLCDAFNLNEGDDVRNIDLFSAETGAILAWIWYLLAEELDEVTPVIRRRMLDMLRCRILHPFAECEEEMWWTGAKRKNLNNWTPWIVSNVLVVLMFCEENDENRAKETARAMTILDRFTDCYPADGGCDEGPGYWSVAAASYFDCLEILWDMTDGKVDIFSDSLVRRMGEYIADFHIGGDCYVNFADASHILHPELAMIARYGRRCGSEKMLSFAAEMAAEGNTFGRFEPRYSSYRTIKNLLEEAPQPCSMGCAADNTIFYENLCVLLSKNPKTGMTLAFKGGTNDESHNHNDVGNVILYRGTTPIFLDAGVETYSKKTFSGERYTLWTMRSLYHNLPEINGCEQKAGHQYRADIVSFVDGVLTLELKGAYPVEAAIRSYRRSARLTEDGAEMVDEVVLDKACPLTFAFMAVEAPVLGKTGSFTLPTAGCTVSYDESLAISFDKVPLDGKLQREWKTDALTRILLTAEGVSKAKFVWRVTV